ncbi:AAA family ATPase [Faecalibacter sp. LW9]|uniref:AAA family ATPase n=1 Tax=Faecalibacter sp. LW9 TaxID=3103144 RepID=UPI002AFE356F|nr:AAA family ATPase [Faecalibacter sp. LW9]
MESELLFVWIEEFRSLKNVGFNFSNKFDIEYISDSNEIIVNFINGENAIELKDGIHYFKEKEYYLDDFFSNENNNFSNISQINAIIGQNSSGKSNLIDFILTAISKGNRDRLRKNYILVFKYNEQLFFYGKTKGNSLSKSFLNNNNSIVKTIDVDKVWEAMFYSNVADNKEHIFEGSSVFNYSFSKMSELQSNKISFVHSDLFNKVWERLNTEGSPERKVKFGFNPIAFFKTEKESILDNKLKGILKRYRKAIFDESGSNINRFHYGLVVNLFCFLYKENMLFKSFLDQIKLEDDIAEPIAELNPKLIEFLKKYKLEVSIINEEQLNKYLNLIDKISSNKIDLGKKDDKYGKNIVLEFNDVFKELLNDYIDLFNIEGLFSHDWSELSSGLKAYINLFSQLFDLSKVIKSKNILICIDEGDLYLHPEWQKNFLNDLMWYMNLIFIDKNIQLILTSHSPFLISDLPKENVVLLEKDGKPNRQLEEKSSFGANIHQLYNNQFFLKNGAIGEFAKNKIEKILDYIDKSEQIDVDKTAKLIQMIGEPVIRIRLEELLKNKIKNLDKENLIKWHQAQIDKLKNK